jgi:hypothetical protein
MVSVADTWMLLEVTSDDPYPFTVRAREEMPSADVRSRFPKVVEISWDYGDDGVSGMPDDAAQQRIDAFDEALDGLERDGIAIEAACVTRMGVRTWQFYTGDVQRFGSAFNEMVGAFRSALRPMMTPSGTPWRHG